MTQQVAKFLEPLNSADQSAVMALAQSWKAEAEEVLYRAGEQVPGIWMIDSGLVRYEVIAQGGRQVVLGLSAAGACFGELEVLDERASSATAVASVPCQGWLMSAASAMEAIETVPAFSKLMLLKLVRNVRLFQTLYQMALILGQHERLALALLNLAQPITGADGKAVLVVAATQETLCQVTGSSRQLVSKYLRTWADLGWITSRYRSLEILDPQGLKSIFPASVDPELFSLLYRTAPRR